MANQQECPSSPQPEGEWDCVRCHFQNRRGDKICVLCRTEFEHTKFIDKRRRMVLERWKKTFPPEILHVFIPDEKEGGLIHVQDQASCHEVFDNIFLGDLDSFGVEKGYEKLVEANVGLVLNCTEEIGYAWVKLSGSSTEFSPIDVQKLIPSLESPLKVLQLPYHDNCSREDNDLFLGHMAKRHDLMDEILASGQSILVHCAMGVSRSATTLIGYVMARNGLSLFDALMKIREKRKIYPNRAFFHALICLEKEIFGKVSIPMEALIMHGGLLC